MGRFLPPPLAARRSRLPYLRTNRGHWGWLLGLIVLAIPLAVPYAAAGLHPGASAPLARPAGAPAPFAPHPSGVLGDLVVTAANSPFLIEGGVTNAGVTVVQGNISVQPGGLLELGNVTLIQQEYIGDAGTTSQRLGHLYTITDHGRITMDHSVLALYATGINPYPKLSLNISNGGSMSLNASALDFAGWISVYGANANLTLSNGSQIGPNPAAGGLVTNQSISNDTRFAPVLSAGGGAHIAFYQSQFTGTYANNVTLHGTPGPAFPIVDETTHALTNGAGGSWSHFALRVTDSENLTRAVLYRTISAATLTVTYTSTIAADSSADSINFGGALAFPALSFGGSGGTLTVDLPANVIRGINNGSFPSFLAALDNDGASVAIGPLNTATTVTVTQVDLNVTPAWNYNLTFSGAGTTLTAVDSAFDLNWNLTPGSVVDPNALAPFPWSSKKLLLEDGAVGYFANVSIGSAPSRATFNSSAILTDATSTAIFYRWFDVNVQGSAGASAAGATITAFFDLNSVQLDNATATALNQLSTTNPGLASYVSWQDHLRGSEAYGTSNASGVARLLLASTVLTFLSLPDGNYLGGYHVAISIPGVPNGTRWVTASVSPYPTNMSPAGPDGLAGPIIFPGYAPSLSISGTTLLVDGVTISNDTVAIGQVLTVQVTIVNSGSGPVTNISAQLEYQEPSPQPARALTGPAYPGALATGDSIVLNLSWRVSENVTGLRGTVIADLFAIVSWNHGAPPTGGSTAGTVPITIEPSFITLTFTPPGIPVGAAQDVLATGTVNYTGNQTAVINVTAVSNTGVGYLIGQAASKPGTFQVSLQAYTNMSSGTYDLNVSAYYNNRTVYLLLPAQLTIGGASTAAPTPFLDQTFLGLPIWAWLVLLVAIVVGVVGLLFFLRSRTKGKLVECGECGELIPETAQACPKCGAEFETDLVRCSRCSATIPAKSTQCPECAAQLLGPETPDPERQGYQDFVEKFRTEGRKELGDNYGEGAFWDWWKRQSSYVPFEQWKLQQSQGARSGMGAPPTGAAAAAPIDSTAQFQNTAPSGELAPTKPAQSAAPSAAPSSGTARTPDAAASPGSAGPAMKPCASCGKEIPPDYLVCPFCGAVTR